MRDLVQEPGFAKQLKKVRKYPAFKEAKFNEELKVLMAGDKLPESCRDHKCPEGSRDDGYRNFHHAPNICVIYKLTNDEVILHKIGSHSDLKLGKT